MKRREGQMKIDVGFLGYNAMCTCWQIPPHGITSQMTDVNISSMRTSNLMNENGFLMRGILTN